MDIRKSVQAFNQRWKIVEEFSAEVEFARFKVRILNLFKNIDNEVTAEGVKLFCNLAAIEQKTYPGYKDEDIINCLRNENDEIRFYRLIQYICLLPFSSDNFQTKRELYKELKDVINISKVNLEISYRKNEIILYPSGEKLFDEKLVNQVLDYLNPSSHAHFVDSLKFYSEKKYIKSAESLRRTLEEFLRHLLSNGKGLEKNIAELQSQLKQVGKDKEIRNIIFQTFNGLDKYFNENSKHKDGDIEEPENEFLIYQTGVLLRYINRILSNYNS